MERDAVQPEGQEAFNRAEVEGVDDVHEDTSSSRADVAPGGSCPQHTTHQASGDQNGAVGTDGRKRRCRSQSDGSQRSLSSLVPGIRTAVSDSSPRWQSTRATVARLVFLHEVDDSEAHHALVSRIGYFAQETYASLHCFLGDALDVTWNATRPVAQPETKAGMFLLAVERFLLTSPLHTDRGYRCTGAACTGHTHSLYAGDDKLRLFTTCRLKDTVSLEQLLSVAEDVGGIVIDQRTQAGLEFCIVARGVGVATQQPHIDAVTSLPARDVVSPIYQLVGERGGGGASQEWMYQLQAGDATYAADHQLVVASRVLASEAERTLPPNDARFQAHGDDALQLLLRDLRQHAYAAAADGDHDDVDRTKLPPPPRGLSDECHERRCRAAHRRLLDQLSTVMRDNTSSMQTIATHLGT